MASGAPLRTRPYGGQIPPAQHVYSHKLNLLPYNAASPETRR